MARTRAVLQTGREGWDWLSGLSWREAASALAAPQTLILPLNVFQLQRQLRLPARLSARRPDGRGLGHSSINAQGLMAPPFFLSFLVCITTTYVTDRTR